MEGMCKDVKGGEQIILQYIIFHSMCAAYNFLVCGMYFQEDPEDLCFKKGDKMTILRKDEEEWWFARHEDGRSGAIPVPYVNVVSGCIHTHTCTREGESEGDAYCVTYIILSF